MVIDKDLVEIALYTYKLAVNDEKAAVTGYPTGHTLGNTVLGPKLRNKGCAHARREQLDTREPSRLQSSLYRILRSRLKREGGRTETKVEEQERRKP